MTHLFWRGRVSLFMKRLLVYLLMLCLSLVEMFALQPENVLKKAADKQFALNLGKARRTPAFSCEGYWVWGSSVVKGHDGKYHMFVSRWPKEYRFHPSWALKSEVVHVVSDTPEGPYKFSDVALPARGAEYWDGRCTHNPRILYYQGKYYLVYMGSTHPFEEPTPEELTFNSPWMIVARSNKRIGLAVADSPYGPWKRFDKPILDTKPGTFYSYFTSNPSPCILEDGSVMMVFKGRHYVGNKWSGMSLGVAYAPSIEGPYTVLNDGKPILSSEKNGEAEDPFFWKDEEGYHIVFKDQLGKYTGEKESGVLAHSKDGVNWVIDKCPQAYSLMLNWDDGVTSRVGQLERPFILFENGEPAYMFFATSDGIGSFKEMSASWNMVIPFVKK